MHFGDWLRTKRTDRNISLEDLAALCNCSRNYLSVIERNLPHHRTKSLPHPSNTVFRGIAQGLGISIQEVQDIWSRLGNSDAKEAETSRTEADTAFEPLKALYSGMNEEDRNELLAYAQFRALRRDPRGASLLASYPSSGHLAGEGSLRIDMDTGSVYTHEGQRVTDRTELLEAAAMIKSQVTLLEIEEAQANAHQE